MVRPAEPDVEAGLWGAVLRGAGLGLGLLLAALALRAAAPGLMRDIRPVAAGAAVLVLGGGALTALGGPRQAVAAAGGYAFGPVAGIGLAMVAQLLGCAADYFVAATLARPWARRRLGARLARLDRLLAAHPFRTTLALRLLPVGNNTLLNLAAGALAVRADAFLLASLLGYVPQTAIFALLGAGVRVGRTAQLGLAAGLFVASAVLGVGIARRMRRG